MPEILDIFTNDTFSAASLTATVNIVPNTYGRLQAMNLFPGEGIPTTTVVIERQGGVLNLLPTRPRGGPPSLGTRGRTNLRSFVIPHIPHDDAVLATDVQDRLARIGQAGALDSVLGMVNRRLITARRKHAITLEFLRMGALKGIIYDYDATTVLVNLFTEFGVTPKEINFALTTGGTNVGSKCREVVSYIEDNLNGDTMTGVHCLASPEFFDALITHASVVEAYKYFQSAQNPLQRDYRRGFEFQGITFEEYRGAATKLNEDKTTASQRFIPAGDARFFPLGTTETFATYFGPPDYVDLVNQAPGPAGGEPEVFVAPLERMKFGKGMEIHTESNPLPMVKRPELLVRGFKNA